MGADLFGTASVDAAVSATLGQDNGDELGANVAVKFGF